MILILLLLFAGVAFSQPTGLRVVRTTHQQITIDYRAPSSSACTLDVRDPSNTLAIDVDDAKFSGSDEDTSRTSTYTSGLYRRVVIGERAVGVGASSVRYSRSLQAATAYTITVTCGSASTIYATTRTVPFGPEIWDEWPYRTEVGYEGYYNYPTKSLTAARETFIDHRRGTLIQTLTAPGDAWLNSGATAFTFGTAVGAAWTNASNASTVNGSSATYAGTEKAWLLIPITYSGSESVTAARINFSLTAQITGGATGDDARAEVCIGNVAEGCFSKVVTINISTAGLAVVNFGSISNFDAVWELEAGYPIDAIFKTAKNAGLMIRKYTTNGAYTLEVDGTTGTYIRAYVPGTTTATPRNCSPNTFAYSGTNYYMCAFVEQRGNAPTMLYTVNATTKQAYYRGNVAGGGINPVGVVFGLDPKIIYTGGRQSGGTFTDVRKCEFTGDPGAGYTGGLSVTSTATGWTCVLITESGYRIGDLLKTFQQSISDWTAEDDLFLAGSQSSIMPAYGGGNAGGLLVYRIVYQQEYMGWVVIFDPTATPPAGSSNANKAGNVIAARRFGLPGTPQYLKAAGIHAVYDTTLENYIAIGIARQSDAEGTTKWAGPCRIQVKATAANGGGNISSTDTQIQQVAISGSFEYTDPTPHASGEDTHCGPVEVGDRLMFNTTAGSMQYTDGTDEWMEITAITELDATNQILTVARGNNFGTQSSWKAGAVDAEGDEITFVTNNPRASITANSYLYLHNSAVTPNRGDGYGGTVFWDYVNDPHGKLMTKPAIYGPGDIISWFNSGNHGISTVNGRAHWSQGRSASYDCQVIHTSTGSYCYTVQTGNTPTDLVRWPVDRTTGFSLASWPAFATKDPGVHPGTYDTHIRRWQTQATGRLRNYGMDIRNWLNSSTIGCTTTSSAEAGTSNVYKVSSCNGLNRKHFATIATSGDRILRDISSAATGNQITDATPWTYCIATVGDGAGAGADECRAGATAGDIFVNSPLKNNNTCTSSISGYPATVYDVCIADVGPYAVGPSQWMIEKHDPRGVRARSIAFHDLRPRIQTTFAVSESFSDGEWVLYTCEDHGASRMCAMKMPPLAEDSSRDPLTFERVPVSLAHATAAKARIEFGYAEHGTPTQYYCTSRREACVLDSATVADATPFKYAVDTPSYVNLSGGKVSIEIPRIPGRIVFAVARFYDSGNSLIESRVLPPM